LKLFLLGFSGIIQGAINIEPSSFKLSLASGEAYSSRILVTNDTDQTMVFQVEPEYWYQGSCCQPLDSWLEIRPHRLEISANAKQNVIIHFKTPEEVDGECMVMIFFAQEEVGKNVLIRPRIGIPLYLRREGTEIIKAEIETFQRQSDFGNAEAVEFFLKIKNQGNVHVLPFGVVFLKSADSSLTFKKEEVRFRQPIFPGQSGELDVQFQSPIPPGKYLAVVKLVLNNLYAQVNAGQDLKVISQQCYVQVKH